jgi:hypothetical protein
LRGEVIIPVPLVEVRNYIDRLCQTPNLAAIPVRSRSRSVSGGLSVSYGESRVSYLKIFLNYIALLVDTEGHFLRLMRKTQTEVELLNLCDMPLALS